jgi:hypothetical protein
VKNTSSARKRQVDAEVAARREQAYRDMIDERDMAAAQALVGQELGGVEIPTR